jgi:hypothetical protein
MLCELQLKQGETTVTHTFADRCCFKAIVVLDNNSIVVADESGNGKLWASSPNVTTNKQTNKQARPQPD